MSLPIRRALGSHPLVLGRDFGERFLLQFDVTRKNTSIWVTGPRKTTESQRNFSVDGDTFTRGPPLAIHQIALHKHQC